MNLYHPAFMRNKKTSGINPDATFFYRRVSPPEADDGHVFVHSHFSGVCLRREVGTRRAMPLLFILNKNVKLKSQDLEALHSI
jgi:hypothetical protein